MLAINFSRRKLACIPQAIALVWLASLCLGCAQETGPEAKLSLVPVKGKVTLGTTPLAAAQVSFHPDGPAPEGYVGSAALTDAEGKFELTVGGRKGAPPGKYKVTVSKLAKADGSPLPTGGAGGMDIMQLKMQGQVIETIPGNYSQLPSTTLAFDVPASGGVPIDIVVAQ